MNGMNTKHLKIDGRISWEYHYKAEGLQLSKSAFVTNLEASKALGAARHQQAKGTKHRDDTRTLAEYLVYWLDNHAALRCQPKTLERYRQLADSLIRLLGHISICDLRPGQEAVNWLQLRGGVPTDTHPQGRPLAPQDRPLHCIAIVHLTACSGCRRGELLALSWADLDFGKGMIMADLPRAASGGRCCPGRRPP